MKHRKRAHPTGQNTYRVWLRRACVRQAVALRVDYATADGQVWLGVVRNLSLQGMYIERTSCQGTPAATPGELLTVALVLPSGRPCKLRAAVVHSHRDGYGVQFREVHPQSCAHLARWWSSLEESAS
jgi:hypothetical protein